MGNYSLNRLSNLTKTLFKILDDDILASYRDNAKQKQTLFKTNFILFLTAL
jgi:hypothetical protein